MPINTTRWEDLDHKAERPLHVRVAEAIGWEHPKPKGLHDCCLREDTSDGCIPHYDANWTVTGPLIEKYEIGVVLDTNWVDPSQRPWVAGIEWSMSYDFEPMTRAKGETPLIAVCELIIKLRKENKLP